MMSNWLSRVPINLAPGLFGIALGSFQTRMWEDFALLPETQALRRPQLLSPILQIGFLSGSLSLTSPDPVALSKPRVI